MSQPIKSDGAPLSGLRVVECAGWNGAFGGKLLADGGADVIRVIPGSGDPLDREPPFFGASGTSIQAAWYNAGKRLLTLELDSANGKQAFLDLISRTDILIEDWAAAQPPFSAAELESVNPALVRVSVTPMGLDGPHATFRTNDLVANALCGSASVTGNASTPPLTGYGNQSYHTVGLYVAVCALAAHRAVRLSGVGQHVDLSAHEALVSCTEQVLMQWFFPGGAWKSAVAARQGSLHWSKAYEVYPASDGEGVMVTAAMKLADVLLPWLKEDGAAQDLADSTRYPDVVSVIRNLPYLMSVLRDWVATYRGDELFYEAQRRHQPFGAVWSVGEALEKSPQIGARGYLQQQEVPGFGTVAMPGRFFRTNADGPRWGLARAIGTSAIDWPARTRRSAQKSPT
ncbi:MAG TPA: CoA transferase, partial [Tepidiformaceae bacterium]|nr:CoA transferase [Tepidiformaceae bacterium]